MSTSNWSEPAQQLLQEQQRECDVLVIGSGYGGSVAAATLANGNRRVWVLEKGREYALGEFPEDIGQLPGHVRLQRAGERKALGRSDALFDVRSFAGGAVLLGSGLGGGSLVNAGVALRPDYAVFRQEVWPKAIREMTDAQLDELFSETETMLGAAPLPGAEALPKFQALARLAKAMNARAEPAPLTIAGEDIEAGGGQPVDLNRCIRCGNCFTGCNYGAKRTLATNLIPRAACRGARFFTGAEVVRIERLTGSAHRFRVVFRLVEDRVDTEYTVDAGTVILSAGALGSTELLMRSQREGNLDLPLPALGARFSANGDSISMGWGQREAVHAFAGRSPDGKPLPVGPTVSGVIRTRVKADGAERNAMIQDGAAPRALASAGVTLGSTLSLFHRYTRFSLPKFYAERREKDFVATPPELAHHAQLLLSMGEDESNGSFGWDKDGQRLQISAWPAAVSGNPKQDFQEGMHAWLQQAGERGFDGGDYLPNPLWRAIPDAFAEAVKTGAQVGNRMTVHPLGGCPMGDHPQGSLVNDIGAVRRATGGFHDGLYVVDGAIVPAATGANPFLTIAALALRAARGIEASLPQGTSPVTNRPLPSRQAVLDPMPEAEGAEPVLLTFRETLVGRHERTPLPQWLEELLPPDLPATELRSWVAVVEVDIDLQAWLADPSRSLPARMRLWPHGKRVGLELDDGLFETPPILAGCGKVSLLKLDRPGWMQVLWRGLAALWRFTALRPGEFQRPDSSQWGAAFATLRNHTWYRELDYRFDVAPPGGSRPAMRLTGKKRLAYEPYARTLWDALTKLPVSLSRGGKSYRLDLDVDLVDMVRRTRLQVMKAAHTPEVIVGLAAFAALWARALVQTHFWSFRGLSYEKLARPTQPTPMPSWPEAVYQRIELPVPASPSDARTVQLELHRYVPAIGHGRSVLLIHGLAHGTGVFTTGSVAPALPMARYFLAEGYTVWLLDHRLSNRLPYVSGDHTIDDLARFDIPYALRRIHEEEGKQPFDVFAHCVGAAAFSMAVLSGRANASDGKSMVRSAVLHAVHPWIVPSTSNQFSAALAAFYKDALPEGLEIDPIPPARPGAMDQVIDRIAATLPWSSQERSGHEHNRASDEAGFAACNRMTLFYGQEWLHENLHPATHARLPDLVGVGGLEVFRQLFFMALRRRLTDRQGENDYLTTYRLMAHWTFPTLFAHGSDNRVFDVRSAVQSWKRLTLVRPQRDGDAVPVRLFVPQGRFGHMDFLFGQGADKAIYPALQRFLESPEQFESSVQGAKVDLEADLDILVNRDAPDEQDITDRVNGIARDPLCGPSIQVQTRAGKRHLALWCEQAVDATSGSVAPGVRIDDDELGPSEYSVVRSLPVGAGVCWWIDIPESDARPFASVEKIELQLRYDGPHPHVGFLAPKLREQALRGFGRGTFHKKVALQIDEELQAAPLALQPPVQEDASSEMKPSGRLGRDGGDWIRLDITQLAWWKRWTRGASGQETTTAFLAASCRWPGLAFERDAVHRVAEAMRAHVLGDREDAAQGLVLLGDQIYVDATANVTETIEPGERGPQRYRDAWNPNTLGGRLLGQVPCWMLVDDHEFGDNTSEFGQSRDDKLLTEGFKTTRDFQWRGPRREPQRHPAAGNMPPLPRPQPAKRGFWYSFEIGGIPAFAADTRTERRSRGDLATWEQARIMGADQEIALQQWLVATPGPKILCSGSVFGIPTRRAVEHPATRRHMDDWSGYPASMEWLVKFIVDNDVRNVIFLSGDYHLSAMAKLTLESSGKSVEAVSIVCSGWNATLPFANSQAHEFDWKKPVVLHSGATTVTSHAWMLSDAYRQFGKVCIRRAGDGTHKVSVAIFGEAGEALEERSLSLS